jgi:hypothetical protein
MILCVYLYTHIIGDFFLPSIEVPGIGYIDANGFAEEQTMQRILAAIQGQDGGGGGGAGMGTLAAGANKAGSSLRSLSSSGLQASGALSDASGAIKSSGNDIRAAQIRYARSLKDVQGMTRAAATGPLETINAMFGGLKNYVSGSGGLLDQLDGNVTSALGAVVKGLFDTAALIGGSLVGDLNAMGKEFREAQQAGALLGGDMVAFRTAAVTAGLSMTEFNSILKRQGNDFARFAGQTRVGALEFMRQNADLINTQGSDLLRLGLNFEDMGSRTAEFLGTLTLAGEGIDKFRYDTGSLSMAIRQQVVQQKALAAINGTTLEQERDKQRAARQDMVLQASLNGLNAKNKDEINNLVAAYPQIATAIKEIAVFGSVTTEAGAMQMMANQGLTNTLEPLVRSLGLAGDNMQYVGNATLQAQRLVDQNRAAIAADVDMQSQVAQLALAGGQGRFIGATTESIEKGFEYNMKVLGDVVENVLGELNDDLTNFGTVAGNTTKTLNNMDLAFRSLSSDFASTLIGLYNTDIAPALLQTLANTTIGVARGTLDTAQGAARLAGFEPTPGSAALGLTGNQNAPVNADAAFAGLDRIQAGGVLDYFTGGGATSLKNDIAEAIAGINFGPMVESQAETTKAVKEASAAQVSATNKVNTSVQNN